MKLHRALAAHPLRHAPYNAIKFVRVDHNGRPLYKVGNCAKEMGAASALRDAFRQFGANCFHCKKPMPPQPLSQECTRDHVRPKKDGGGEFLHNLVVACGPCNKSKGSSDVISFRPSVGSKYLRALDAHLVRCLKELGSE